MSQCRRDRLRFSASTASSTPYQHGGTCERLAIISQSSIVYYFNSRARRDLGLLDHSEQAIIRPQITETGSVPAGSGTGVLANEAVIRTPLSTGTKVSFPVRSIEMVKVGKLASQVGKLIDTHPEKTAVILAGTVTLGFGPDGHMTLFGRVETSPLPENAAL